MNEEDAIIQDLIEDGSIEIVLNEDGQEGFKPTELLEILHPAIYDRWMRAAIDDEISKLTTSLWMKGFIDIVLSPNGNDKNKIYTTQKTFNIDLVKKDLTQAEIEMLAMIIKVASPID